MKVLVLHSGGMDSTTCLYKAIADGHEVVSLGIDYGQRLSVELLFAKRQCEALGIAREVISVEWTKPERTIPLNRSIDQMAGSVSSAFLPARNALFLTLACAQASGVEADEVHTGINCMEFSGYPDCTIEFLESFQNMMKVANPTGPRIVAPLHVMTKPQIAVLARDLGIGEYDTWSCYRPQLIDGNITPCHQCDACRLHDHAWRSLGEE